MAHPSSDVAVHLDVKSPSGSGLRAVLSDPLDEYMDFDTLCTASSIARSTLGTKA